MRLVRYFLAKILPQKTVFLIGVFILSLLILSVAYAQTSASGQFGDIVSHWAITHIQKLAGLGILSGYPDNTFKPDSPISRAEVAAVISRTLNVVGFEEETVPEDIAAGGRLYDKWWGEDAGASKPEGDHPLWSLQNTNLRSSGDTWRCKECHGWDYKGAGGAYSSGSHYTGFSGIVKAVATLNQSQLKDVLKGSTDYRHDFSPYLSEEALDKLAAFLKDGIINDAEYIDYAGKKPKIANLAVGKEKYDTSCAYCHGSNGKQINFGSDQEPEYIGTIANNPWEFAHKVRFGQPGTFMPVAITQNWTIQDVLDVLGYSQTLPKE